MTSTNDGKDVKSNQTSGHKGKSYYIDLYKSLEKHLSEECELRERTQHLCEAWRRVHSLCQHSAPTTHPHYLAWLQRHTANTLLQSEWQSEKDEHKKLEDAINSYIAESKAAISSRNGHSPAWESQLLQRGQWFKSILGNPWGHPVLKVLCDPRGKAPTDEEILEWLKEERGVMLVTRLRHLAASRKCHEIALSLAAAVMARARASEPLVPDADQAEDQGSSSTQQAQDPPCPEGSQPTFKEVLRSEAGFTVDVWELITDLELVLLHKRDEHAQCIALAKKIPLRSGYQLVERLRSRPETSPREKKLWKNAGEVATLVAQVLITRCMVVPCCGGVVRSALYCCARSLVRLVPAARLRGAAVALAAPAATARHLHTLAAAIHTQLHAQNAQDMNSFVCELYVRAITAGMNELEKLKIKTEKESEARVMEQTLALWFTSLGALLQASARIQGECALTAFSVHPSPAMYDKIKMAPALPNIHVENLEPKEETKSKFGSWANDSRGQTNLVKTSETLNLKQTQQHTNVMSTAIFTEGEAIGLSAELCQDLTVCLSGPRVKTLSWDMDREALLESCQKYMARTHGGTRALTTELKYLNLDPRHYQHLPEEDDDENDVYYGIEKGYEHLVELQEEASWEDAFLDHTTETAYSSGEDDAPRRRKKKTKRRPPSDDGDSDPLSTLSHAKPDKKERPHSKERSKERKKKPKDPEKDKEKADNKEKKKRERKKKPKEPPVTKPSSLAALIGVKIARGDEIAVTDSDYDSQGKSSLASEGNDPNVVFDGLFSMDHKYLDKIDPLSDRTPLNNELDAINGVAAVNKPKRKPSVKRKPKVNANVLTIPGLKIEQKPRPSAVGVVSEQVKRSITKLLQFRRNQNAGLAHKNAPRPDIKPVNAIYKPDFPVQPFVSPKSVVVPEIPKSYINKATLDRSPSVSNYGKVNEFMGPPLNRVESSNHSLNETVRPPSTNSAANVSSPVNYKDIMNVQHYYQNMNYQPQPSKSLVNDPSRAQPKNISMSLTRVEKSRAPVSEHEKSYEKFLRELKSSINAGTGANLSPSPTAGIVIKKDYKPAVRSLLMPSSSTSDLSTIQCAKQLPQKKVENAPNTFSRLSYMHKNKQSDIKQKQALETQAIRQDEWNKQVAATLDLSRSITEFKNTKIKYIQTKGETVITRVDNPLNLSCDKVVQKVEKLPSTSRSHPVISSMLQQSNIPQSPVSRNNNASATKVTSPPGTSYLSEKDQNDLVLLLQQRNRINAVKTIPRVENVSQNLSINMTTTPNKPACTIVQSKPVVIQGPLLNNHLQQNEAQSKTGQLEAKPDTVINYSRSAAQKQDRVKKTAPTKPKPIARKERTKLTHLESNSLDWESVMNEIRAQKTPSRGPSAIELALNKDSTDSSLRNQRIVRTSSVGQLDKVQTAVNAVIQHTNNVKSSTSLDMPILTTNEDVIIKTNNTLIGVQNKPLENKKAVKNPTPKRVSGGVDKKQTIKNKFALSASNNKDIDPFIHGRDDDYNLSDLDDLLDDELRRELGELSSDEDAYRIPQAQKGIKITYGKNNVTSKQNDSLKEKTPNATILSSDQLRPTNDVLGFNCQYPKSRETSTVRSQVNKKQKSPVQTCLLKQSKAPCNENVNKNILRKENPVQQVTDLSSRHQNTATNTVANKNMTKDKVTNSTLHYKYQNNVHSNVSVEKDTSNTVAERNQTPSPSLHKPYAGTANTNVNNVYVVENKPVIQVAVPAANVVLFGSEMYYNPNIQTQLGPGLCTINQTYVQQTAPNIALYQTANFAAPLVQQASFVAPIVTPILNTINVPVTTSIPVTTHETLHAAAPSTSTATDAYSKPTEEPTSPKQCVDEPQMANSDQPIVVKECAIPRHTNELLIDTTSNVNNKATFDIKSNKNLEQKPSLDVRENQKHEASKLPRSRTVSTEEISRDILNDQEENQTIKNNVLINTTVKHLMTDGSEPHSHKDNERLKRKRLAILNREIIQSAVHPPIALSYSPIFKSPVDICDKMNEVLIHRNKELISQEITTVLKEDESIEVEQNLADAIDIITQEVNDTPLLKNDDTDKPPNEEHSKDNTSSVPCRRILLRSSNKNLPKISETTNDQNPVGRKTKVRLKAVKPTPETDTNKLAEGSNQNVKTQNGIFTLKTVAKKNGKRKAAASKKKKAVSALANDVPIIGETAESIIEELCKNVAEPLTSDNFDIEEALLGSKIPNKVVADPLTVTLDSVETGVNETSNVKTKKPNKVTVLENRKITLRRKRKSAKVVNSGIDTIKNYGDKIEVKGNSLLQTNGKPVIIENNCLNKIIVAKKRQSLRNNPLLRNSVAKPEQANDILSDVWDKTLSSKLKSINDEIKVKADAKKTALPQNVITNRMSEISKKDLPKEPSGNIANGTFQNVFENATIPSIDVQKSSKITDISKTIADLIDQINKGDILDEHKDKTKNERVISPITATGGKTVSNPVSETSSQKPVSESNVSKKVDEKTTLVHQKNSIPQSYKDSIVIEEIPNDKAANNVSKLLRVKLPNGKVYKASVYGKMHTSFDSLFEDPSLRAMLMSNFNEQMKYTLNIKQVSIPNKENPDKPIDTRIQEIQVKSSSMKPAVIETINLLSDDEESDDTCSFKTKSGIYKTILTDRDVIAKHQAKFDRGCSVIIERLRIPEKVVCPIDESVPGEVVSPTDESQLIPKKVVSPIDESQTCDVIEIDEESDTDKLGETLPPVVLEDLNKTIEINQQNVAELIEKVPEVIEIDDESSNDSIDLLKSCPNLPVALIADVPINSNVSEAEGGAANATAIIEENIEKDDLQSINESKTQSDNHTEDLDCNVSLKEALDCYVSLSKCDHLVDRYKNVDRTAHIDPAEELDTSFDTSDAELSSNASFSILNDFNLHPETNHEEVIEGGRSSPVISIFEIIASLHRKYEIEKEMNMSYAKCEAEWFLTQRQLRGECNLIKAQMIHPNKNHSFSKDGRSSPVIGVFEVIASLRSKYASKKESKPSFYHTKCQCEWLSTKRHLRQDHNFIDMQINVKNGNQMFLDHQLDNSSSKKQPGSAISTPSLLSIMSAFFRNSSILDHLKPLTKNGNTQRIKRRKSSISNLKRKMQIHPDNIIANKMSKNEQMDKKHSNDMSKFVQLENYIDEKITQNDSQPIVSPNESEDICHSNQISATLTVRDITAENVRFMGSESPLQSVDKMIADVEKIIQNQQFENITDIEYVENDNVVSDDSKTFEKRNSKEFQVESVPSSSQIQQACEENYIDNAQKENNITVNINSNTFELPEEKEVEREVELTMHDMTAEVELAMHDMITEGIHDNKVMIYSQDPQVDETDDVKDISMKDIETIDEVKTAMEEVFESQGFAGNILSNDDQQVCDTENVQNDDRIFTSDSEETKLEDKIRTDDICDRHAVLVDDFMSRKDLNQGTNQQLNKITTPEDYSAELTSCNGHKLSKENVENNQLNETVLTTCSGHDVEVDKLSKEKVEDNQIEETVLTTCSGHDVESVVEDKLPKEKVEDNQFKETILAICSVHNVESDEKLKKEKVEGDETVTFSSHDHELNNTIGNTLCDKSMYNIAASNSSQIKEIVEELHVIEADKNSCHNPADNTTSIENVQKASNFMNTTIESVESHFEDTDITEIADEQNSILVMSNQNDLINCTTEVSNANNESKLVIETVSKIEVLKLPENSTREEVAKKLNIGPEISSLEQQIDVTYNNIHTGDCDLDIESSGCYQVYEIIMDTDEIKNKQDIETAEVATSQNQNIDETMDIKRRDTVECSLDNSENIFENVETYEIKMKGQQFDEVVAAGNSEDVDRQIENDTKPDNRTMIITPFEELLAEDSGVKDEPNVNEKSENDDETVTIIEVKDNVDMHVEVIVEREDQESLSDTTFEESVKHANENIELAQCDSTTGFDIKSHETVPDSSREPKNFENYRCKALMETCEDTENNVSDHIEDVSAFITDKDEDTTIEEKSTEKEQAIDDNDNDNDREITNDKYTITDHEYTYRRQVSANITALSEPSDASEINNDSVVETIAEQDEVEQNDSRDCLLRGIEFQDPEVGTLYVLYPIDDCGSDSATLNDSCDTPETLEEIDDETANSSSSSLPGDETLRVNVPKITYSKQFEDLAYKKNLKRKIDFTDPKFTPKKYRKGKNIDYPKITAAAIIEQGYVKEYKRVFDYSNSLKFSYTRPFHKDYLDVDETVKDWPIKGPCLAQTELAIESEFSIFTDTETNHNYEPIPMDQSLGEEINQEYSEISEPSSDIHETNFKMGFGEGSGRVIQNLEDVGDISKVSAATLSDVKQHQPFLLSERKEEGNNENTPSDQLQKIQRYLRYIKLREKVKSFFQKSTIELKCDSLDQKKKELLSNDHLDSTTFPFGLYIGGFIEPPPFEPIIQVVQVGQLPVSAAAQNPVTCDPRVTQVSDASPSQCSVDNSPQDDSSSHIKTEYTELTTADLTNLPLVQEYAQHNQTMECLENPNAPMSGENIPIETEIKSVVKIELEELEEREEMPDLPENTDTESMAVNHSNDYSYEANNTAPDINMPEIKYESNDPPPTPYVENNTSVPLEQDNMQMMFNSTEVRKETPPDDFSQQKQNGALEKTDQIAHAMSAAGITTTSETIANNRAQALVNIINQKIRQGSGGGNTQTTANSYSKTTSINAMALQQALAQILPPPLNQTNTSDNNQQTSNTPQVLHIVQGKNASGSQITLVDNSQQSVISGTNATPVLHIVQNKSGTPGVTTNGAPGTQNNSFSGLSLVDTGLQQGGNQLLHIVNTGSQKNNNTGQLLKRVNLLTNLTNVQGSNEQKMVQFVCKSADGKSIQLNAPHQRSMVLRLQPIESPAPATQAKSVENQDANPSPSAANNKDAASQQEIKSRSVYEENYAKFIQNSGTKPAAEKSTSLPKFNQAFGKPVFQDGTQKSNDMNSNNMPSVNTPTENNECPPNENAINLEHIGQISSPPLLLRKSSAQTSQAQTNLVQQIKQTIAPMNIQTMHGGVIYTRQIPVNIGGGQTINLITVPSTELIDESGQKQQSANQGDIEPSIIKIVPQSQSTNNAEMTEDGNANMAISNENNQNPQPQPQPVLTQMRIKLPMLSKTPQMVGGARVVRPSFFQIQRNVIGGANQPVYQQLVLTAAPPLGQQTIRLPTATRTQIKVPTESQSSTESMSSSTLEQLREFDMVLEQVKERSTVQPNTANTTFPKLHTPSSDTTDNAVSAPTTPSEQTQVLYSIGNNQQLNVAYVNRKATVTTPTTSNFVRSPDSSGVADSPTSSTHVRIPHTVASESTTNEVALNQPKPAKVSSKSKSRPKSSSHQHSALAKINPVPAKTSTQKPLEDEQTTQRILYILAEYKEQVENSPDKDKPAPRRRSNPPSNPGSSKRKKSSSGSRRISGRDMSPVHGDETCRTMGSEDSSCGTSQGDCNENCLDSHSPQDSPRKIVRKLTYEPENAVQQPRPQPQRNVIVADGQTITVARGTAGKPATAVLMPANYILPVSMVKGGQQIAIVTNRGPKLLTVGGGEGGATNALLLQRLIGPGGLKPVLARPGVRHVRLPTAALHNLQAFNLTTATTVQPPDSTASPVPAPTPPELVETRAASSPWTNRESEDVKPERGSSPEGSEPWNLPSSADPHDYTYEETVRADNMDRTVLDPIPDRYSPDMEAQRIFDKMFDVDNKKSYISDSPRCGYDIDASECDDKPYQQVVHKKDGTSQRHHRLTHVSAAALRHKYAILEHELRLQKSLSEECEDLGVDSPSASELFPEAELLFAASPAHDHTQDQGQQSHTPQPTILNQSNIPQPDMDDQIATDQLLPREDMERQQLELGLEDVGIVSVGAHRMQAVALDHEEFARAHPNTTFHTDEPTDDEPVQPFAIAGLKGRHITSTIFHSNRAPATVLMTAPQTTVISQASAEPAQNVKYADIDNMINSLPPSHNNINLSSVLVKEDGLTRFDNILNDSRELHLTNTASAIVHSTGNATQVIRRVCYDDKRDSSFLMDEPDAIIAGDDAKMIAEDSSRDATLESMADVDDDRSSPERHAELFWESNSASERSESRRPLDFSSDSEKCCKSPSYDETNSTDSSGVGTQMRLDSVIKEARGIERSGSADGSSADDTHPPLRTYPPKRLYHPLEGDMERSLSGKTRAGERSPDSLEVRRRASGRGVVKRGCHCCNGSPAPPRPKKSRQRKPTMDFTTN